jgi:hypothetical protein
MKKLLFIIVTLLMTTLIQAQSYTPSASEFFCTLLIQKLDGTIEEKYVKDGITTLEISLPAYYNINMVTVKTNELVSSFSDVWYDELWHKRSGHSDYRCGIIVVKSYVLIAYIQQLQRLAFFY